MIGGLSNASEATELPASAGESPQLCPAPELIEFPSGGAGDRLGVQPSRCRFKLVQRSPSELQPHPILAEYRLGLSVARHPAISTNWDPSNLDPICITQGGAILKGLEEWELGRKRHLEKVNCLEYDLDEEGIIRWILDHYQKTEQFNDFVRILIALILKPTFRELAQENERHGGQLKGSVNLPNAHRVDCRGRIARAAGVADRQVDKVEFLCENANPELLEALRSGEVRINRAWVWVKKYPESQLEQLTMYRVQRGIAKKVDSLLEPHRPKSRAAENSIDIRRLGSALATLNQDLHDKVLVSRIRAPGQILFISSELLKNLETQGEFNL